MIMATTPETELPLINGKHYHLWQQFVDRKSEFIGKRLQDFGDNDGSAETRITDVKLTPNGTDSAYFEVVGEEFGCGFDVHHGGITGGESGWITFAGYGGHKWRIESEAKRMTAAEHNAFPRGRW